MKTTTKTKTGRHPNRDWGMSTPFRTWDEDMRVGQTIKTMREMRGFTSDEMATAIGISRSYFSNIEAGRKRLSNILLARISDTLRVEQNSIMLKRPEIEKKP